MKKRIFSITTLLSVLLLFGSCDKFLDVTPDNLATIDYAFRLRTAAESFLFTCYSYMPSHAATGGNPAMFGADEFWLPPTSANNSFALGRGNQRVVGPYMNAWQGLNGCKDLYQGIRDCNVFLENINTVPDMNDAEKKRWSAEVLFLKAYYHYYLVRMYGPVVLIRENLPVNAGPDEVKMPRSPVDECFAYILSLLDDAFPGLPEKVSNELQELGRITQPICLSLKAKVLVTAASDLFNGNQDYRGFANKDGTLLFDTEIGEAGKPAKWQKAAQACKAAIDSCHRLGHELYYYRPAFSTVKLTDSTLTQMSIRNSVCERWNSEIIWANTNSLTSGLQGAATPRGLNPANTANSGMSGSMAPPLKIIEMFYSENGVPIKEDNAWDYNSRFNIMEAKAEDAVYLKQGYLTAKMNFRREPRYYADLGFDGSVWYGMGHEDDRAADLFYVACKRGQPAAAVNMTGYSTTGYWPKKLVHFKNVVANSGNTYTVDNYPWPVIRLADLYLLYAEALNEAENSAANRDEAISYLDKIRDRAGLLPVRTAWLNHSNRPAKPESQSGLREIVRQERTIELMFEFQRFWDLRRWKTATDDLNRPVTGWDLDQESAEGYYRERLVYEQKFTSRDYLWPLNEETILANKNLVQNPGWESN
ncbi:MAG: RagB/SusD family nutrient uptake outer membrane protein [Bacteroidales bacterium]|nr:RagB/SusD family nutrient uptake outer membrane protein [Bacteroidales bacterium]